MSRIILWLDTLIKYLEAIPTEPRSWDKQTKGDIKANTEAALQYVCQMKRHIEVINDVDKLTDYISPISQKTLQELFKQSVGNLYEAKKFIEYIQTERREHSLNWHLSAGIQLISFYRRQNPHTNPTQMVQFIIQSNWINTFDKGSLNTENRYPAYHKLSSQKLSQL